MSYDEQRYWTRLHEQHPDSLSAVGYPEMGRGFNTVSYEVRLAAAEEILRRSGCAPRTLLEGAVGVGAYSPLWAKLGIEQWVGLDLSDEAVASLRVRFQRGTFAQFDLTAGEEALATLVVGQRFELVTAIDVLYHIVDESGFASAIRALASRVAPRGYLLFSDVFVHEPTRVARHVLRRPFRRYEELLAASGLHPLDREPVFALLGDPVPRPGFRPVDLAMTGLWRVLSKVVRTCPPIVRDSVGRVAARTLVPLDSALKHLGRARGVNLELALFRRLHA